MNQNNAAMGESSGVVPLKPNGSLQLDDSGRILRAMGFEPLDCNDYLFRKDTCYVLNFGWIIATRDADYFGSEDVQFDNAAFDFCAAMSSYKTHWTRFFVIVCWVFGPHRNRTFFGPLEGTADRIVHASVVEIVRGAPSMAVFDALNRLGGSSYDTSYVIIVDRLRDLLQIEHHNFGYFQHKLEFPISGCCLLFSLYCIHFLWDKTLDIVFEGLEPEDPATFDTAFMQFYEFCKIVCPMLGSNYLH